MTADVGRRVLRATVPVLVLLAVWEVVGRFELVANGALPAPSAIAAQWWTDRADYPEHIRATLTNAAIGFVGGTIVGVLLALAFSLVPVLERMFRGVLVTVFCLPLIVVAPVLAVAFTNPVPSRVLAGLAVVFPMLVSTLVGLQNASASGRQVVHAAGGGRLASLLYVRLPSARPGIAAGLQIAAPAALLGALLGEFLGGRWGLGIYLLGSMSRGIPERIWAIGMTATLISAAAYGLFGLVGAWAARANAQVGSDSGPTPEALGAVKGPLVKRVGMALLSIAIVLVAWQAFIVIFDLPPTFARGPVETFEFLFTAPKASANREVILDAMAQTVPLALLGLAVGLLAALVMAVVATLRPGVARGLMPICLLLQSMPLVALTPVVVIVLGRDLVTVLAICASVTFFPAFVTISQGLASAPPATLTLMRSVDASTFTTLWRVRLPTAVPHLLAAASLAAPRCILGVMIAEYLAVGGGLGFLLAESRGKLSFGMMWAIAAIVVALSVAIYRLVAVAEHWAIRRFGPA